MPKNKSCLMFEKVLYTPLNLYRLNETSVH